MLSDSLAVSTLNLERLYISYHQDGDGQFYAEFCRLIEGYYLPVRDDSLDRRTGNTDAQFVMANLQKRYMADSVCTVVLCGLQTAYRRFVDWEIKTGLDLSHGLVGIILPENLPDWSGRYSLPARLADNLESGYAECLHFVQLSRGLKLLGLKIEAARNKAPELISNSRPLLGKGMWSG